MKSKAELYQGTYKNYGKDVYEDIRKETYGEDIGQTSWLTAGEYRDFFSLLKVSAATEVLEIATGSGGPAVFMVKETGCHLTGIDINGEGVNNAKKLATQSGLSKQMDFLLADASGPLPFADESFDIVISIDSINHFKGRQKVLEECKRVLKTGGQLLFTDPVVVTGIVSSEEIAARSSIGFFLFVPAGQNEKILNEIGFKNIQSRDLTGNIASVSRKWHNARQNRKDDLVSIESEDNFKALQSFFNMVHILSSERRLSRYMFVGEK